MVRWSPFFFASYVALVFGAEEETVSVYDLQFVEDACASDWSPYLGRHVRLEAVFVTSVAATRFTVADAAEVEPWSGVVVDVPRLTRDLLTPGLRVSVSGRVVEYGGETRVVDVTEVVQGRKRVIQRRFDVGAFEAISERKASTL